MSARPPAKKPAAKRPAAKKETAKGPAEIRHEIVIVGASPAEIYRAFVDADEHARVTGAGATGRGKVGGRFTAWDGYIDGRHLELRPPARIVQAWRTSDFDESAPDSRLELQIDAVSGGTRITMIHSGSPPAQRDGYDQGWHDFYWDPLRAYFSAR